MKKCLLASGKMAEAAKIVVASKLGQLGESANNLERYVRDYDDCIIQLTEFDRKG